MEYGVYLDGEVMETHDDYFKACEEAQQLTRDTGIVHWAMPIKEKRIDKTKVIELIAKTIVDASERGKDYSWMYDTDNYHLDRLCEELDISAEEIQDIVFARKNIATYEDLVLRCKEILSRGWTEQAVYNFMDNYSGWAPDSITFAIDEVNKRAASKS